ncbi:MAG: hypothetical protein IKT06_03230 [Aeriscardovia sp.]|nr:hypothetical protein [Aeriscardovia sp.]
MVRVAGIDCGTNSVKMEIADISFSPFGPKIEIVVPRKVWTIRLGEGVDETRLLSPYALRRLKGSLESFKQDISAFKAEKLRFVATSAVRDAKNEDDFRKIVEEVLGVEPEILTGKGEGRLGFEAACMGMKEEKKLLVDLGGGSTEFSIGEGDVPSFVKSLDIGCVRIAEKFGFGSDPLPVEKREKAESFVQKAMKEVPIFSARRLIGISGSVAVVSFMAAGEKEFSPSKKLEIEREKGLEACEKLMGMSEKEMEEYPLIPPLRRKVIRAGALIWAQVLLSSPLHSYLFSDAALLDGVILDEARRLLRQC